jgi:hypothetical protein
VKDNGNGTYTGKFDGLEASEFYGQVHGVGNFQATVNGDLPGGATPINNGIENINGKNVSWAAIAEKLWAAVNGSDYSAIDGVGDSSTNNDHDIQNGLFAITGKIATQRDVASLTLTQIQTDLANGVVVVGTSMNAGSLTSDHAIAVIGVNISAQTMTLADPEGGNPTVTIQELQSNVNQYFTVPMPKS